MTAKNAFTSEAIKFGWNTVFKNFPLFLGLLGIYIVLWLGGLMINSIITVVCALAASLISFGPAASIASAISVAITVIIKLAIDAFVFLGIFNICLKLVRGEKTEFGDFFKIAPLWFKGFLTYVLVAITADLPLLIPFALFFVSPFIQNTTIRLWLNVFSGLLGIIGSVAVIIFALALCLAIFFVLDKKVGPIQAMKLSVKATKGAKWQLFVFGLALLVINILGILCLFVGLLITFPLSLLACTFVYQKLSSRIDNQPAA